MADPSTCPPLIPSSIATAHAKIAPHIHRTPLVTSKTLNEIASSPDPAAYLSDNPPTDTSTTSNGHGNSPSSLRTAPKLSLHFKAENLQRIGAFKARGAFHAIHHLISLHTLPVLQRRGVITHSSGNHAQALALAASEFQVPSYIVMPGISTASKISGTRRYATEVIFSGSTSVEREQKVKEVMERTRAAAQGEGEGQGQGEGGAILVPPYDHPDIILGQGTVGKEMWEQFGEWAASSSQQQQQTSSSQEATNNLPTKKELDAVIAPIGGGGLLGGIATWFSDKPATKVFGAEPSFEGADDARRGLAAGKRIETVKTLTIADGLRTPVGVTNWEVVSDKNKVEGVYSVTEEQIKMAMRLVWERMKCVVEPSGCVALAVVLFNEEWRRWVVEKQREERGEGRAWEVGVVFSGGNTTMKAVAALFGEESKSADVQKEEREVGKVSSNGERVAENVAG